jgi:hypothetical protein
VKKIKKKLIFKEGGLMEVLDEYLKKLRRLRFDIPNEITRDNVNRLEPTVKQTILGLVLTGEEISEQTILMIEYLLSIGATIHPFDVVYSKYEILCYLLDKGYNPNTDMLLYSIEQGMKNRPFTLIDYGAVLPKNLPIHRRIHFTKYIDYTTLSNSRVATSRKALSALLWCCKRSFIPLRGIILELARSAWALKGGEGCGPRGKEWVGEK